MNVHEFLNTYLGGNKNVSTLTYDALAEMLTNYTKALQLQQTGVMARFNISEDELIKELEDKRICKLSDLPEEIYYLHRKETARWLLEKYDVFKK